MKKLLLLPLLALPLIADDAQPLSNNFVSVAAVYKSHVNFLAEYGRLMKDGVYSVTSVQTIGIYNRQLQTSVNEAIWYMHNLGEYLTLGASANVGIAMDHSAMGMTEGSNLSVEYKFGKSHWGFKVEGGFLHSAIGGTLTNVAAGPVLHWK